MKTYYEVLGVSRTAAPETIKRAYRQQVKLLHPDLNPSANPQDFLLVKEAYEILADPYQRSRYDAQLREEGYIKQRSYQRPSPGGFSGPRPRPPVKHPRYAQQKVEYSLSTRVKAWSAVSVVLGLLVFIAIAVEKKTAENHFDRAVALYGMGQYGVAISHALKSTQHLGLLRAEGYLLAGAINIKGAKNFKPGMDHVYEAMEFIDSDEDSMRSFAHLLLAEAFFNLGKFDQHKQHLKTAINSWQGQDTAYYALGIHAAKVDQRLDSAMYYYQIAFEREPKLHGLAYELGYLYYQNDEITKAADKFKYSLAHSGYKNLYAEYYLANAYLYLDSIELACVHLSNARELGLSASEEMMKNFCR